MFTLLDPINADLAFTLLSSLGLLLAAATTLAALPWTDAEIASTEKAFIAPQSLWPQTMMSRTPSTITANSTVAVTPPNWLA